jgi:hypothetical protein
MYIVIKHVDIEDFEKDVNAHMQDGYKLHGQLIVLTGENKDSYLRTKSPYEYYIQAMIKDG